MEKSRSAILKMTVATLTRAGVKEAFFCGRISVTTLHLPKALKEKRRIDARQCIREAHQLGTRRARDMLRMLDSWSYICLGCEEALNRQELLPFTYYNMSRFCIYSLLCL